MTMETPPITPPPTTPPTAAHVCPKCLREFVRLREARPHILSCKGRKKHLPPKLLAGSGCEIGFTEHYQDIALGEDGNVAMVTENRLHILSVPLNCRKKEVLSAVTVECEFPKKDILGEYSDMTAQEHWYTMGSNGVTGVKRVFWLPSLSDKRPHLLALHNNGSLVLYRQSKGSLQWEECGNFSKKVRMFVRANERPEESLVSVFMTQELQIKAGQGKPELAAEAELVIDNRAPYHSIDGHSMPNKYHTGPARVFNEKTNGAARTLAPKMGRPRKTPVKNEPVTPSREKQPSREPAVDPDADLVVPKRLIKQLTKTAKDGVSKRVVKIIDPSGENADENADNVNCPCGAKEEDSSADEEWVECELCHVWQHMDCVGYYPEVQDYFHCEDCVKKSKDAEKKIKQEKGQEKKGRPKKLVAKKERVSMAYVSDSDSEVEVTTATTTPKGRPLKAALTPLQLLEQELDQTDSSEASSKKGVKTLTTGKGRASKVPKLELAPSTESEEEQGEKDHINCPCGAETSESGEEWVQCDECDKWQHQDCVDYKDGVKYQCPACKESKTTPLSTDPIAATKPLSTDPIAPALPATTPAPALPALPASTPAVPAAPAKPKEVYRHNLGPPIEGTTASDGFKVVGSSDCQISFRALQPIHVKEPKHVLMVNGDKVGEVKLDKDPVREDEGEDLPEEERREERKEGENGDVEMVEEGNEEDETGTEDKYMFMFLVYERYMLVLRMSSDDLATPKVVYCSAISQSSSVTCSTVRTVGEREYSIATSHNNGEVHIQWLEVVGEGAVVPNYQYERSNYPAVQMTEKIVIPAATDVAAERLAWSGDRLVVLKLQQVTLYSVSKGGAIAMCIVSFELPFVMDWYVTVDSVTLFDMYGQDVVIQLSTQSKCVKPAALAPPSHEVSVLSPEQDSLTRTDLNKRFRKANVCTSSEINVLRTLVSESGMLKCQVLLFKKELSYLGHLITVKLSPHVPAVPVEALKSYPKEAAFLQNKFNTPLEENGASASSSMLRSCLSGKAEELAELEKNEKSSRRSSEIDIKPGLRKIFVDSLVGVKSIYHMKDTDIIRQILGDPDLTSVCPVCAEPLTLSPHPLLAFCQNGHRVTLDPLTFKPLDNGLECQVCGCINEGAYCGICWAPTQAI